MKILNYLWVGLILSAIYVNGNLLAHDKKKEDIKILMEELRDFIELNKICRSYECPREWDLIKEEIKRITESPFTSEQCNRYDWGIHLETIYFLLELESEGTTIISKLNNSNYYIGLYRKDYSTVKCLIKSPSNIRIFQYLKLQNNIKIPTLYAFYRNNDISFEQDVPLMDTIVMEFMEGKNLNSFIFNYEKIKKNY